MGPLIIWCASLITWNNWVIRSEMTNQLKGHSTKKWNLRHTSGLIHWFCRYFSFFHTTPLGLPAAFPALPEMSGVRIRTIWMDRRMRTQEIFAGCATTDRRMRNYRSPDAQLQIAGCATTDHRMRTVRAGNAAASPTEVVRKKEKYRQYLWIKPDLWRKFHILVECPFKFKTEFCFCYLFQIVNF